MQSSKLLEIIKGLETEEQTQLDWFLQSPFFFSGKPDLKLLELFRYLIAYAPDFNHENLDKNKVYKALFPSESVIKGKLEKLMTALLKSTQQYIIYTHISTDPETEVDSALVLARFYRQRKLDKHFEKALDRIQKKRQTQKIKDKTFFFQQFLIEREISAYESFYNTRKADLNLPSTLRNLDIYYILAKQEYTSLLLAQNKYHIPIDLRDSLDIYNQILPILQSKNRFHVPLIEVYNQALLLLQHDDDDSLYPLLRELLQKHEHELPLEELKALQALCRNYSIRQCNKGSKYLEEAFSLYKEHLEAGYLYYNEGLLASTIKNLVGMGLRLKAYDWVLSFLQTYRHRIVGTRYPEEIYNFNLASYHFAQEQYEEALDCLEGNYEDTYYKIAARRLEIKIYYEMKSILLDAKLDAFKVFIFRISRSKIPPLQKTGNNNFVDLIRKLSNIRGSRNVQRAPDLLEKIVARKVVADEEWLTEKVKELI